MATLASPPDPLLPSIESTPTPTLIPAPDAAQFPATPLLAHDLIRTAYQVFAFVQATGEAYYSEIPREIGLIIEYIRNYRSPDPIPESKKG